jgi:hypothetical protein
MRNVEYAALQDRVINSNGLDREAVESLRALDRAGRLGSTRSISGKVALAAMRRKRPVGDPRYELARLRAKRQAWRYSS